MAPLAMLWIDTERTMTARSTLPPRILGCEANSRGLPVAGPVESTDEIPSAVLTRQRILWFARKLRSARATSFEARIQTRTVLDEYRGCSSCAESSDFSCPLI